MEELRPKKFTSKKKTKRLQEKLDSDVKIVVDDFYDESTDLLSEEVWEYMNEQDELCLK